MIRKFLSHLVFTDELYKLAKFPGKNQVWRYQLKSQILFLILVELENLYRLMYNMTLQQI